jgi:hypothetical protein
MKYTAEVMVPRLSAIEKELKLLPARETFPRKVAVEA